MIAKSDLTRAYLVDAAGPPPEIFSTWDGTLRMLVGIVVGLAVGMAIGAIKVRRDQHRQRMEQRWR